MNTMQIDLAELNERLEEAVRVRAVLRRATLEWREFGRVALAERSNDGLERPDDGGPPSGASD